MTTENAKPSTPVHAHCYPEPVEIRYFGYEVYMNDKLVCRCPHERIACAVAISLAAAFGVEFEPEEARAINEYWFQLLDGKLSG